MLRSYKVTETKRIPIPFVESGHTASMDCEVFDSNGNLVKTDQEGKIELTVHGYKVRENPEWFACLAFKTPNLLIEDILECKVLEIGKLNPNEPKWIYNYGWKFPKEGIEHHEYPGYRFIPGATKYLVDQEGNVINWTTKSPKRAKGANNLYQMMRVVDDSGHSSARMLHRLVGLAWLDYPMDVHNYEINHKDGVQTNNQVENLEWVTKSTNVQHAIHVLNRRYQLRNIDTNEEYEFGSLRTIATIIDCSVADAGNMVRAGDHYAFRHKWQVKHKNDEPWFDNPKPVWNKANIEDSKANTYVCMDYHTGNTIHLLNLHEIEDYTGLTLYVINRMLSSEYMKVIRGFAIKTTGDQRPFPTINGEELEIAKVNNGRQKVVRLESLGTGSVKFFENLNSACDYIGCKMTSMKKRLVYSPTVVFKNFRFSYVT